MNDANSQMAGHHKARTRTIIGVGILAFLVIATGAFLLCFTYSEYETQSILNHQRDVQQTLLDKSLDTIRVWRGELVNQAKFISSSEMFRIFITDTRELTHEQITHLADPEVLHSPDDNLRALAEQRAYMQDLLKDFVRRQAWSDARLITTNGEELLSPQSPRPLTEPQRDIVKRAVAGKMPTFGPIRKENGNLYMDMADPLFEVLGSADPNCVAVLLLSVPIEKPLLNFLTSSVSKEDAIYPCIIDQTPHSTELLFLSQGNVVFRQLKERVPDKNLPFGLHPALASLETVEGAPGTQAGEEAYSLGSPLTFLDWHLVLETPAVLIQDRIQSREWEIYGLGALSTLGLTLLAAFLFANMTSRQHKARANYLNQLYNTINQQKLVLDGVNNSLQAGLLLVDSNGVVQMANPAFREICKNPAQEVEKQMLVDVLPAQPSIDLIGNMKNVMEKGASSTIEQQLPGPAGDRLFRITLFPYQSQAGEAVSSGSGCVAIFQDITLFRANAKKAAKRQEALLTAMDRAIESVDPNLVGQSAKMAALSNLLADKLGMNAAQKETLRIASLLSQIGKLFVPRELLLKKGNLSEDEKREVGRAPEHADRILSDLNFDLPVRETVREMGERLDGSGPNGLKERDLSGTGRALAVVNAFIAMTSPRAWRARAGMDIGQAINILVTDPKFDPAITRALSELDKSVLDSIIHKGSAAAA